MGERQHRNEVVHMKTVSLILTTYNSADNLVHTLKSIEEQDYPQIEVVIKDGGSKDGTLKVIKGYEASSHNKVVWATEPDKGIYDAMNQGYLLSSGDIIVFFNDVFLKRDAVSKMARLIEADPGCVGAHADLVYAIDDNSQSGDKESSRQKYKVVRYWKMGPQKSIRTGWLPGHPTMFLKREIYEKYGLYDLRYRISADYEFMIRFLKDKENRLIYLPETIIRMFYGGTSNSSLGSYLTSLREGHMALKKNGIKGAMWIDMLRTCRVILQFVKKVD